MKKTSGSKKTSSAQSDLKAEYRFDYAKSKPNRFAARMHNGAGHAIVLDPDVAEAFVDAADVNNTLRAVIKFRRSLQRRA